MTFNTIISPYLLYVFGDRPEQTVDSDQAPQNASDHGLHCLPLTQQFNTNSQVVKWTWVGDRVPKGGDICVLWTHV